MLSGIKHFVLKFDNINFKIEYKYVHFKTYIKSDNKSMTIPGIVDSDIAKLVIRNKLEDDEKDIYEVNIVPKKSGERIMNIDCEIFDNRGNTIGKITKKVKIIIDDNLNTKYSIIE